VTALSIRLTQALAARSRIAGELGQGGTATVYLAEDVKHAIEVLKPELAAVLGAERFVQEIKTTAALGHPHILPLFDSGEAADLLYYVMPYIEGETIREKLNRETQLGIEVRSGTTLTLGARKVLFSLSRVSDWDVAPDGRFLLVREQEAERGGTQILVENFFVELEAKAAR